MGKIIFSRTGFKGLIAWGSFGGIVLSLMYLTGFSEFLISKHLFLYGTLITVLFVGITPTLIIYILSSDIKKREKVEVLFYLTLIHVGVLGVVYLVEMPSYMINIEALILISFGLILLPLVYIKQIYNATVRERGNRVPTFIAVDTSLVGEQNLTPETNVL